MDATKLIMVYLDNKEVSLPGPSVSVYTLLEVANKEVKETSVVLEEIRGRVRRVYPLHTSIQAKPGDHFLLAKNILEDPTEDEFNVVCYLFHDNLNGVAIHHTTLTVDGKETRQDILDALKADNGCFEGLKSSMSRSTQQERI